ncbi:MAG: hypothetical protein HYZ17_04080 [Betaproteobacteria bacterium]|nr:hypothetical protein [Betaproteobacteria bacterium]
MASLPPKAQHDLDEWANQDAKPDWATLPFGEIHLAEICPTDLRTTIAVDQHNSGQYLLRRCVPMR